MHFWVDSQYFEGKYSEAKLAFDQLNILFNTKARPEWITFLARMQGKSLDELEDG